MQDERPDEQKVAEIQSEKTDPRLALRALARASLSNPLIVNRPRIAEPPADTAKRRLHGKQWIAHDKSGGAAAMRRRRQMAQQEAHARARTSATGRTRCEACLDDFDPKRETFHRTDSGQLVCSGCVEYLHV